MDAHLKLCDKAAHPSFAILMSQRLTVLRVRVLIGVLAIFFAGPQVTLAAPNSVSVEDYGLLPHIRIMAISPDGSRLAFIQRFNDQQLFTVVDRKTNKVIGAANASSFKARSVYFATNSQVILVVSTTRTSMQIRGKWEQLASVVYNVDTQDMKPLLAGFDDLFEAQSGFGRIVGIDPHTNDVFMPAYVGTRRPANHLMRVSLETGLGKIHEKGKSATRDWFLSLDGVVLAREDYSDAKDIHTVWSKASGDWKSIYVNEAPIPEILIDAVTADGKHLVFSYATGGDDAIYYMALYDGEIQGPFYSQTERDIDLIISDALHREFKGIQISGPVPDYLFLDEKVAETVAVVKSSYPTSSVVPVSANVDWSQIIFEVSGNEGSNDYLLYEANEQSLKRIGLGYPSIPRDKIAQISAVRYEARDGLMIPAIITWPAGQQERTGLPLLVFPHGGPEAYDRIRFDWWAQYFAQKGYMILQPNFRGSTGYGAQFRLAGRGEWGQKMQDDISDGVATVVEQGYVDPDRVCIMGASYGGYAALAGGAFSPELYRCVIAVAGISDLPRMMRDEIYLSGGDNSAVTYWRRLIGDSRVEQKKLKLISPINSADSFAAPVLLVHGASDTVVPLHQSTRMHRALKRADKEVELVKLKGEDHWLSKSDTRLATLRAISTFLNKHNPATVVQP